MLLLLLTLFFAGFGMTLTAEPDAPRESYTYTVHPNETARPPELWPKRSTHNAPDG
jgi:hypothetical protein